MGRKPKVLDSPPTRIRELRLERGLSIDALAKLAAMSKSAMHRLETGETQLRQVDIRALSRALSVMPAELQSRRSDHYARVMGYVGAGAQVYSDDPGPAGFGMVPCPPWLDPSMTRAAIIRGDSALPIGEGWRAYFTIDDTTPGPLLERHLCIVKVAHDGPYLMKEVRRGYTKGRFNLISTNAPPMEDVEIDWAVKVRAFLSPDDSPLRHDEESHWPGQAEAS